MQPSWQILSPTIALAITVAAMQSFVFVAHKIREHDYRRFEDDSELRLLERFPIPKASELTAEERLKSISPVFDEAHRKADLAQTTYYNAVVRSAGCLVLAFVALALGTLRPEDWPDRVEWPHIEWLLSWVDVIAILFVLVLFYQGRQASQPWIAARTSAELLRQNNFLNMVFPNVSSTEPTADPKTHFDAEFERVFVGLRYDQTIDIAPRIEQFWSKRRMPIQSYALSGAAF